MKSDINEDNHYQTNVYGCLIKEFIIPIFQLNPLFVFILSHFCFSISAEEVSGPMLKLWKVSRMDMGAYMCIARNGVPPAVSKRIELGIDCEFTDKLQCRVSFTQKMNTS